MGTRRLQVFVGFLVFAFNFPVRGDLLPVVEWGSDLRRQVLRGTNPMATMRARLPTLEGADRPWPVPSLFLSSPDRAGDHLDDLHPDGSPVRWRDPPPIALSKRAADTRAAANATSERGRRRAANRR